MTDDHYEMRYHNAMLATHTVTKLKSALGVVRSAYYAGEHSQTRV